MNTWPDCIAGPVQGNVLTICSLISTFVCTFVLIVLLPSFCNRFAFDDGLIWDASDDNSVSLDISAIDGLGLDFFLSCFVKLKHCLTDYKEL